MNQRIKQSFYLENGVCLTLSGRHADGLNKLIEAGKRGLTTLESGANRFAATIHKLKKHGLTIGKVCEKHGGKFPGRHARYFLLSKVKGANISGGNP